MLHQHGAFTDYRLHLPQPLQHLGLLGGVVTAISGALRYGLSIRAADWGLGLGLLLLAPFAVIGGFVGVLQKLRTGLLHGMINQVPWRGDEYILDVGSGSGILLFTCLKGLKSGKGIGIDIYDPNAGGGTPDIFLKNAQAEGLQDRVKLQAVDARTMPFADSTFDLAVSSLAMHHVGKAADQQQAVREMIRVLKPGGKILILDVPPALVPCEQELRRADLTNIRRTGHLVQVLIGEKP